ncbi:dermonecrotic toxin domain-containing protein [Pseudomonas sp. KCJK9111]|uniref:dermonecrotic toxin domain-containing protein n=1 Tax=Pseudomonas sp. KCJK9111 TaxID=3344555 RepID=UPI00390627FF
MPTPTSDTLPLQGVHYSTIAKRLPQWLKKSPAQTHQALRNWRQAPAWLASAITEQPAIARAWSMEHAQHRQHQAQVAALFEQVADLESYARKALTEAIAERFGLQVDVDQSYLVDARLIEEHNALDGRQAVERATRSLLQAALHNFEASAAVEGGMDAPDGLLKKSVILDHRRFMGTVPITNALDIPAEAFADLCRTLDIGRKYHDLIHAIYYPAATADRSADEVALEVYQTLGRAEGSAWRQSLHYARLKGDISETFYTAALAVPLDQKLDPHASGIRLSELQLWGCVLTGVVVIERQSGADSRVALYMPDDEQTPLKEFTDTQAMHDALRDRLQADMGYLDKHVPERDKAMVRQRLQARLMPLGWSTRGLHEPVLDPHARLYPVQTPFNHAFEGLMAFRKVERHEQDVLFHAVPTEIVDRRTAQAHRELIAGRALLALNIAGFFVPGLGEAMLLVGIVQLAHEVYEGIDAWEADERDTAYDYLVDVVENVAVMAALAAAGHVLKGAPEVSGGDEPIVEEPDDELGEARIPVETPSFIEELEDVDMPDGQVSLWKPDLRPYQVHDPLPQALAPDEHGLLLHEGRQRLVLQSRQYQVVPDADTGQYRLQHPRGEHRYQPPLRHNGAGAWILVTDRPATWTGSTLLQRMGHLSADFDEPTLRRTLQISDTDEDAVRRALVENERLPALLQDTLQRFKLDQSISQLPTTADRSTEFSRAYSRMTSAQLPDAEPIMRAYPGLPAAIADELVSSANANERGVLASGRVPLRLSEEIRVYLQQVRLARAYEGLFLVGAQGWDSDRLVLHTLPTLSGWPAETRLQIVRGGSWPTQAEAVGPEQGSPRVTIIHARAGYIVQDQAEPSRLVTAHPDLFIALHAALPEVMALLGAADAPALQHLMQESPLLPRPALRKVLGMRPVRPGYRSPMRLADGRLGYPLSGGGPQAHAVSHSQLIAAVEALELAQRTGRSADQVINTLASGGRTRLQIFEHLQRLAEQRTELQSRLDDWSEAISPPTDEAARNYDALREAIVQFWYDSALDESDRSTSVLRLAQVSLADIPLNLPEFFYQRVRSLILFDLPSGAMASWAQNERLLQRLLRQMPQLEALEIDRPYTPRATPSAFIFSIPTILENLPQLQRLVLTNQNIALSSSDLDMLTGADQLRHLDLSGNRLAQSNRPSFHALTLDYLGLDRMQLSQWPMGIGSDALSRIGELSLRDNNLLTLPSFLLHEAESLSLPPVINLEGNPINEIHVQRLLMNEQLDTSGIRVDQPPSLIEGITRLRNERSQVREALEGWAQASSSSNPLTQTALAERQRIETAINDFWTHQEQGHRYLRLQLEDVSIEHFPRRLPPFFGERVRALALTRLRGTTAQLDELLSRFPGITRLTIDGHQAPQPTLPTALLRLPALEYLELRNMNLEIDQPMFEIFGRLPHLTSLDLSGNRVGTINHVPAHLAANLQSLVLSNMDLQGWPSWCDQLLPLELLDLSSNNITELPDHILSNLDNAIPISSVSLLDNPLPAATIQRVRTFSDSHHSFSFALDIPNDLLLTDGSSDGSLDHPHFPVSGDDTPRMESWMLGNALQNESLQACWDALAGSDLLRLAGRLQNAAPYVEPATRGTFCERVRLVLVAAVSNPAERPLLESIAAEALPDETGAQTCHDGALQAFNNIELYLMHQRVVIDAGDSLQQMRQRLLQLFRVEELERLAQHRAIPGDLVSVRLAYRRELAKELELPIADRMRFRSAANLAADELSSVLEHVRKREHSEAFIDYLLSNQDWTQRLRGEYAERFEEIENRYRQRVMELANTSHPLQEEVILQQGLQVDRELEEQALLRELTLKEVAKG